jgi:hypothetical protein
MENGSPEASAIDRAAFHRESSKSARSHPASAF